MWRVCVRERERGKIDGDIAKIKDRKNWEWMNIEHTGKNICHLSPVSLPLSERQKESERKWELGINDIPTIIKE